MLKRCLVPLLALLLALAPMAEVPHAYAAGTQQITIPPSPNAAGGNTYTTDGSALPKRDLTGYGYVTWLLQLFQDSITYINAGVTAINATFAGQGGTSATSFAIGTGAKTFTLDQSGVSFAAGALVQIIHAADKTKFMIGTVGTQSGTSLPVTVTSVAGSGTFTDWLIVPVTNSLILAAFPTPTVLTGATTVACGGVYLLDTSGAAFNVTLPSTSVSDCAVVLKYPVQSLPSNKATLIAGGSDAIGAASNTQALMDVVAATLWYHTTTALWTF